MIEIIVEVIRGLLENFQKADLISKKYFEQLIFIDLIQI